MNEIESLINDLSSDDRIERSNAIWGIVHLCDTRIKPQQAVSPLRKLMENLSEPYIRMIAAGAILRILGRDSVAMSVLVESLDTRDHFHRSTVCDFLGEVRNDPAVLALLKLLLDDENVYANAGDALSKLTGNLIYTFEGALKQLAQFDDELTKCVGREHLLFLGRNNKEIIPILRERLNSLPWDVRLDAEEIFHILKNE